MCEETGETSWSAGPEELIGAGGGGEQAAGGSHLGGGRMLGSAFVVYAIDEVDLPMAESGGSAEVPVLVNRRLLRCDFAYCERVLNNILRLRGDKV